MNPINLESLADGAKRPRILLIDFEESDASFLQDIGYNVYLGHTGLNGGKLFIPVEHFRVDIVIYRCTYRDAEPNKSSRKKPSAVTFCKYPDQQHPEYVSPHLHPESKCKESELFFLRDHILQKGGSTICFLGQTRLASDDELFKSLMKISGHYSIISRDGGRDENYEIKFLKEYSLKEMEQYFEKVLTEQHKHKIKCLRGVPRSAFSIESSPFRTIAAYDENEFVYAFFQGDPRGGGNKCFLPDFGRTNIIVVKELLELLPKYSTKEFFFNIRKSITT